MKKKIGVILKSNDLKLWQTQILNFLEEQPQLSLEVIVVDSKSLKTFNKGLIFQFFQWVDSRIFPAKKEAFLQGDFKLRKRSIIDFTVDKIRGNLVFLEKDYKYLENLDLDVLINLTFLPLGPLSSVAKLGVWFLRFGDLSNTYEGPPGFLEVMELNEVSEVNLLKQVNHSKEMEVLGRSFTKTDFTSFNRNKNEVIWAGVELMRSTIEKWVTDELCSLNIKVPKETGNYLEIKSPSNLTSLKTYFHFWTRRIEEAVREIVQQPQWFLLYNFNNSSSKTSILNFEKLLPPKGFDWADPFIIKKGDEDFYLFFEELHIRSNKGHISFLEFNKKGGFIRKLPTKVLEEEYHLSYPFIFEENGTYYMLPESANSGELWLYEALEFPKNWIKRKRIFANKYIYDATLYKHNGFWYLFGTEKIIEESSRDQFLTIYYSEDLFGEWKPHQQNPIYRDVRRARPAGKIINTDNRIIRPSQIGTPKYGYGIQFNEIEILSPTKFLENRTEAILPDWEPNLLATHTYNSLEGLTVLDAQGPLKRK